MKTTDEMNVQVLDLFEQTSISGGKAEWLLGVAGALIFGTGGIGTGTGIFIWGVYNGYNS